MGLEQQLATFKAEFARSARLIAISPQLHDRSLSTAETNELTFDVLSDVDNRSCRSQRPTSLAGTAAWRWPPSMSITETASSPKPFWLR